MYPCLPPLSLVVKTWVVAVPEAAEQDQWIDVGEADGAKDDQVQDQGPQIRGLKVQSGYGESNTRNKGWNSCQDDGYKGSPATSGVVSYDDSLKARCEE